MNIICAGSLPFKNKLFYDVNLIHKVYYEVLGA